MRDLFTAELLRFRAWAALLALVHLVVLAFLTRVVDLAQQPWLVYAAFGAVYALAGALLGGYQMGVYRRPNTWLALLHRPVAPWRLAAALMAAAALLLAVAVALPIVLTLAWQTTMTARVVDQRHLLLALSAWQVAACGYLAGAYAVLGNRRWAASGLVLLAALPAAQASGAAALALQALLLAWLCALVLIAFRPELGAVPRGLVRTALVALPLQMALYLGVLLLWFAAEMLWIMAGTHPNNTGTPPAGGHNQFERLSERERLLAGLAASTRPDAPRLREQVALSEPVPLRAQLHRLPQRGGLTNVAPMEFDDARRRVRWIFSHDSRRLHGVRLVDGQPAGVRGVGAADAAFAQPPLPVGRLPAGVSSFIAPGDTLLAGGDTLYRYDSEAGRVTARVRLPDGEPVLGVAATGAHLVLLGERAIYLINVTDWQQTLQGPAAPRLRLPTPGRWADLSALDLVELADGWLLSYTFTHWAHDARGSEPRQVLLRLRADGTVETVAQHELRHDYPAWFRHRGWWLSPVLKAVLDAWREGWPDADPLRATAPAPRPPAVTLLALAMALLSAAAAAWRTRRLPLAGAARAGWVLACGVFGLPALFSLWLLHPPPLPAAQPVPPARQPVPA